MTPGDSAETELTTVGGLIWCLPAGTESQRSQEHTQSWSTGHPLSSNVIKQTSAVGERWVLLTGCVGSRGGHFVFLGERILERVSLLGERLHLRIRHVHTRGITD